MYLSKNYEEIIPNIIENKTDLSTLGITQIFAPFYLVNDI